MRAVENRTDIRVFAVRDATRVDYDGLGELADGAWRHDYAGKARVVYDADYFLWLLEPRWRDWLAVIAVNETDEPVGCIVSLLRTLCYAGREYPALHSTAWTVAPAYRNRNVAIRLARAHSAAFTDADDRQVGVSLFHAGHAGMRAQGVFGGVNPTDGSSGARLFHRGALWSRRLLANDASPAHAAPACRLSRLSLAEGQLLADGDVPSPGFEAFRQRILRAPLAFAPTESFARMYLRDGNERSGTLLFGFDSGSQCLATYSMQQLALDDVDLGKVGQIQNLLPTGCTPQEMATVVRELCAFFRRLGCVSVSSYDQGCVDAGVLQDLGFSRSSDELVSNLWATPRAVMQGFPGFQQLAPPYLLDII